MRLHMHLGMHMHMNMHMHVHMHMHMHTHILMHMHMHGKWPERLRDFHKNTTWALVGRGPCGPAGP